MRSSHRRRVGIAGIVAALAFVIPVAAKQTAQKEPTKKDPIRFAAVAMQANTGQAGMVEITIERWSTDAERKTLVDLLGTARTDKAGGQNQLLKALQGIKLRVGFIRLPNTNGWDLKYARENMLDDGSRQVVIATDKPVAFLAAAADSQSMDYPFSLVEMRFPKGSEKGEGKLLARTAITTKNGRLELEQYGVEPTRLTTITETIK